jgi:hypothetical protein
VTQLRDLPGYSLAAPAARFRRHEARGPDAGAGSEDVRLQARGGAFGREGTPDTRRALCRPQPGGALAVGRTQRVQGDQPVAGTIPGDSAIELGRSQAFSDNPGRRQVRGVVRAGTDVGHEVRRTPWAVLVGHERQTFESPKTPGSRHCIDLTAKEVTALLRHRAHRRAEGFPVEGDTLVFTHAVGKPVNHSHLICRSFKPLLRRAGLPETTFHVATRHTCCCILLCKVSTRGR